MSIPAGGSFFWNGKRTTDPSFYQSCEYLNQQIELLRSQIGVNPGGAPQNSTSNQVPAPPLASFAVTPQDGYYLIAITNPSSIQPGATLLHELASSTTMAFDADGSVATYGPSSQLSWKIGDPNVTKYWRLRSRYLNSGFNAAQYAGQSGICGPAALYSGLLRSSSNAMLNTGTTPVGTNPLTQSGTTTVIDVAQKEWTIGSGQTVTYDAGSVDPGGYGTWYIYAYDPKKTGGAVVYQASSVPYDVTVNDATVYLGSITTVSGGGGTGGGGGSGPCGVAGALVTLYAGGTKDIAAVVVGDVLLGTDGGPEVVQSVTMVTGTPCFSVTASDGGVLSGCSSSHKLMVDGGYPLHVFEIVAGAKVWRSGPSTATVTKKEYLGLKTVYRIELDRTRTYWLDGFASHNFQKP